MHKLDPIERLPDGPLFRLTPGQLRSVRGLTKRCCNFLDGDCLLLDGVCPQFISRSLLCRWFRRAGLPQQPKLEQAILSPKKLRRCEVCGTGILARSGRAKYCPACAKEVHRQQKAKSARQRRSGVDNSGSHRPGLASIPAPQKAHSNTISLAAAKSSSICLHNSRATRID